MIVLSTTSDLLKLTTSSTAGIDVHVSYVDYSAGVATPGVTNTAITTATTTTICGSPAAATYRAIKTVTVRNIHGSTANDVVVQHYDGTNTANVQTVSMAAGWATHYEERVGWTVRGVNGLDMLSSPVPQLVVPWTTVILGSDVKNESVTPNTIADITGLSFAVTSGLTYWFQFHLYIRTNATTTGYRVSANGPALTYTSYYMADCNATATWYSGHDAWDLPAACLAASASTDANLNIVEGIATVSAGGTIIGRLATEIAGPTGWATVKAGSFLRWQQVA